jgi:hypothetical protein
VQNTTIQEKQDLSEYFSQKTIRVTGEAAYLIPGKVRNFEYFNNTLFLIHTEPENVITAISEDGSLKWQLLANDDPISAFTALSAYHFDPGKQEIKVFDHQKQRIYSYDFAGAFLGTEETTGLYATDFFVLPSGEKLFSIPAQQNEFEQGDKKAALAYFAKNSDHVKPDGILLNNPFYSTNRIPFTDAHDFFQDRNGNLFYHRDFEDTIFQVNNLIPTPLLTFSFAKNDLRKSILSAPEKYPLETMKFLEDNIPYPNFSSPCIDYFLISYTYNEKEIFSMIDMTSHKTIFNTQNYTCAGKNFSGRLDYSNGILLNQMYAGNYQQLNPAEDLEVDTKYLDNSFVYTILLPKW